MATDKKSFIAYCNWMETFEELPDVKAGQLVKHLFRYVNDLDPKSDDILINAVFINIKQALKRDLVSYKLTKELKSNAGKLGNLKRWNKDLYDKVSKKEMSIIDAEKIALSRKESQSDVLLSQTVAGIAVNDSVSDSVSDIKKEKAVSFISKKFGFNEINHFPNYKLIVGCVVCQIATNQFNHFEKQCTSYFQYKEKEEEKIHHFKSFIGTPENKHLDGGWNAENWSKKLNGDKSGELKETPVEKGVRMTKERLAREEK